MRACFTASRWHVLLAAAIASSPLLVRLALLVEKRVSVGLGDVHGFVSDVFVASIVTALVAPAVAKRRALGLLLALGQVPADLPEGFATIATFKNKGVPRSRRILLALSFTAPILLGATLGYWAVRGQPDAVKFGLLAFTAGILLTVAVEEIVVEAHQGEDSRWASLFLVGGFALFALLTAYIG